MSEPKEVAQEIAEVAAGVWHWRVWDDRIGAESHAHALALPDGTVLIDPLPLAPELLRRLEPISAILLSAACHQRSAWRYRRSHDVAVYAPDATRQMEEERDFRYRAGQELPGGIVAVHTPGPELAHLCRAPAAEQPDVPRIFVHYSRSPEDARRVAAEVALYLASRGYEIADVRDVGFAVSKSRVRYFFVADAQRAEQVAEHWTIT